MRVLIGCEFSGRVRAAFRALGHDAWSCDLLPAEDGGPHLQGDVRDWLDRPWDLLVAHPPCTHTAVSGARWFKDKRQEQADAVAFFRDLLQAPLFRIALEQPVSVVSTLIRPPDQWVQPWQFGHAETKRTGLWLKNLPPLVPRNPIRRLPAPLFGEGAIPLLARVHREPPGPERWKNRSRTPLGFAAAMAEQWGSDLMASKASALKAPPKPLKPSSQKGSGR